MTGCINRIETLGLKDGPGIRVVVFMASCPLRCIYCHNPEMLNMNGDNYAPEQLVEFILKYQTYFKDQGGVTFSGGEPLNQFPFLLTVCKLLKQKGINIALDTSGIGLKSDELLNYLDLIIIDIKALNKKDYHFITNTDHFDESVAFIEKCASLKKKIWFRQVIIPNINNNIEYIKSLKEFTTKYSPEKIELLPYHTMAKAKYTDLKLPYQLKNTSDLDINELDQLKKYLVKIKVDSLF